ncbi:MAG: YybH family protein [Gemmatimonadota bacterium]
MSGWMSRTAGFTLVSVALLSVAGCGITLSRPVTAESEEQDIRDAREAQNAAIRARDLDAIARYWEADVQSTAGTGVFVSGRDEYRLAFEEAFADLDDIVYTRVPDTIELSTVDVEGVQRLASESGTWTGSWTSRRGPTQLVGVYTAMWQKRSGRWRIRSELFVALSCSGPECRF